MSPETVNTCPLCGSSNAAAFDQRKFHSRLVVNCICQACGLVYQSPRMDPAELASYYESEYRLQYQGDEGPNPKDLATQRGRAKSLVRILKGAQVTVTSHLDIGCSAGLLLQAVHEAYPCQSTGVEPGRAYREYAQGKGLKVHATLEALEGSGAAQFDLISLAHVLEHLPDPVAYLAHLRSALLQPNGRLLIEVPNLYAHDSFETAHLVSYSAHTLSQVLHKAGFIIETLEAHGRPRSEVIPLYLSALARPSGQPQAAVNVEPERRVAFKRRLGLLRRQALTRIVPGKAWQTVQPEQREK